MSSFLRKLFPSSDGGTSPKSKHKQTINTTTTTTSSSEDNEAKRKKLSRRLALAQTDPEPLLDLADLALAKLDDQILSLIKVYHKQKLHFERNHLGSFVASAHFANVTVLHLEENLLTSFEQSGALSNLKELYLSSNRLATFELHLPKLKVLSLRSNHLTSLGGVLDLPELVYCDLAYNQIVTLPVSLCQRKKTQLETLLLEGNPLGTPDWCYLERHCQDVNGFVDVVVALRTYYNVKHEDVIVKESEEIVRHKTTEAQEDDTHEDSTMTDYFRRIEQRKIETKHNCLEWERSQQLRHEEREQHSKEGKNTSKPIRDKLLGELCEEQRGLVEKIDLFHSKKLADRQKRLEDYIRQVQEHSSRLIEKLSNDSVFCRRPSAEGTQHQPEMVDRKLEYGGLDVDIRHLLERYDENLRLKRNGMLDQLQATAEVADQKLNESFQLKDSVHGERCIELQRQEEALSGMFDRLLDARDRRNVDLVEKITLVEQELLALTFCERERKELRSDTWKGELDRQRARLVELLTTLLEVKRSREKMLKETLEKEVFDRLRKQDEGEGSWLEQVQQFLAKESFEVQVAHHGLDIRLATILINLYHDLEHEPGLRTKLAYYLAHFVDVPYETLLCSSAADLMGKCTIHDYELCQVIALRFGEILLEQKNAPAAPSAPPEMGETIEEAEQKALSIQTTVDESGGGPGETRYWHEAECVICLVNQPNIVFLPCGHICTCQACIRPNASILGECPLCRIEIEFMQSITIDQQQQQP